MRVQGHLDDDQKKLRVNGLLEASLQCEKLTKPEALKYVINYIVSNISNFELF